MPEEQPLSNPFIHDTLNGDAGFGARVPWLWATVPAIALGALTFAFLRAPLPQPLGATAVTQRAVTHAAAGDWVVPASETLVVTRRANDYVLLRGNLQPPSGTTIIAPQGGQIAQVLTRPGQLVRTGQALLMISRGVEPARSEAALPPGITRAERDQVSAERQGEAAQDKVKQAHARLDAAQNRVQAAQEQVARARDLVRRLQNGEEVGSEEVSTPATAATPEKPAPQSSGNEARLSAQREQAMRESQRQGSRADAAEREAAAARRAADAADATARAKQKLAQSAQAALADARASAKAAAPERAKPDAKPDSAGTGGAADSKAKTSADAASISVGSPDVRAAQSRADAAQSAADDAQSRAAGLRRDADKAKTRAADLRAKANDAARSALAAMQDLQVFEGENKAASTPTTGSTPKTKRAASGDKITAREAARIVRAAVAESEAAVADADRIRREVESLDRPVTSTVQRVESSKKRFDNAQQDMWSVARETHPRVAPVTAPASGVVLWIAELAREVQSGAPLGAIGRTDRLEVVLRDTSGAWKSAKPGAMILALVQSAHSVAPRAQPAKATDAATNVGTTSTPAKARTANAVASPTESLRGVPTLARVLSVTPPRRAGEPALIKIAVHNPRRESSEARATDNADYGLARRVFEPDTPVVCSLSKPTTGRAQIVVPAAAIRRGADNQALVAVFARAPGATPGDACRVEWRKVQLGSGDGFQNVILSGLEAGDRIALRPDTIYNFTLAHGPQATLRVEQA
jgi:hypothetical protein